MHEWRFWMGKNMNELIFDRMKENRFVLINLLLKNVMQDDVERQMFIR